MTQLRGNWRSTIWIWYLAATGALTSTYFFVPGMKGSGPVINTLGFSGVVAIAVGIKLQKPTARWAWWLFVVGQLLFFSGDLYTYSYPNASFPSVGDALYLAVYPVLMAGLFVLVKRRNPRRDLTALIDALILTIGIGLFSWAYVIAPNIHLSGSFLVKAVSIAYPAGDVLLLAAAIRLAVDTGKRAPAFYLLVGSIVCLLTTDSAYNIALLKGTYDHSQLIYDLGWILYYLLWGAAALHPSMRVLEEPSDARTRLTKSRLAVLGLACLISPAIRFAQAIHDPDRLVLIVGSAVLFLLVVTRMAGLVRQEERAFSRERTLRSAGVELVGAAGHEQVYDAAMAGVARLLGDDAYVRVVSLGDERTTVVASSDDGSWTLSDAARSCGIALTSASKAFNLAALKTAFIVTADQRTRAPRTKTVEKIQPPMALPRRIERRRSESADSCTPLPALPSVGALLDGVEVGEDVGELARVAGEVHDGLEE